MDFHKEKADYEGPWRVVHIAAESSNVLDQPSIGDLKLFIFRKKRLIMTFSGRLVCISAESTFVLDPPLWESLNH